MAVKRAQALTKANRWIAEDGAGQSGKGLRCYDEPVKAVDATKLETYPPPGLELL